MTVIKFCPIKSLCKRNIENANEKTEKHLDCDELRMPLCRKISYGIGGPPMQMTSNAMGFYLSIFLLETALMPPYYMSAVQIIARVWDAVTDPITGFLVSITRSRIGKFKPWIIFGTPLSCLSFFLLFYVPYFSNEVLKCVYYSIVVMMLQTGLTAFHVPYSSMCMVIANNPHDRDQLTSIRMAFEIIGILCGAGVFGGIGLRNRVVGIGENVTVTQDMRDTEKRNYCEASGVVCLIFVLCAICVILGTKEQKHLNDKKVEPYGTSLRNILTFKPYLCVMFAFLFISLGIQIIQNNLALYVTHVLKRPKHVTPGILVLLCCALILVPVGHQLMRICGKKKVFSMGLFNMFPILLSLIFLPENLHLGVYYFYMVWVSFSLMVAMVLPWSMLPDVIDMFMVEHGCRKEATFYSFYVFFNKFAVGISLFFSAIALGLAGYKSGKKEQPESVSQMLRYFISLSGFLCFIMSMVFLRFYPITEKKRKELTDLLQKMRGLEDSDKDSKLHVNPTCESNLDCICNGAPINKHEHSNVERVINDVIVKSQPPDYVDFLVGSGDNLLTV